MHSFSCFVSSVSSSVTERRFWISTSVPVCQVTAQHLPINPCKYPCPASWMGNVLSWLLVHACSLVWSCPPPLPSNTTHAGTAGALMVRVENLVQHIQTSICEISKMKHSFSYIPHVIFLYHVYRGDR